MARAWRGDQDRLPLARVVWWRLLRWSCVVWFAACYRLRAWGGHYIPPSGPVLLVANHQSFFDPIIVGISAYRRPFFVMARETLWRNRPLGWLIGSLNAIQVNQTKGDLAAMRRLVDVLRQGHALLVFPEGVRTGDGTTGSFATGTMLLIRRARPTVVPIAIEGAFDVWPIVRKWPRLWGRISVKCGKPIGADELIAMGSTDALTHVRDVVENMRLELVQKMKPHEPRQ